MAESMHERAARANLTSGQVIVHALVRLGVGRFYLSPGSRSTPLALAIGELPKENWRVCLDERSAGFQALGWSKASGGPAALVCTSGSAGSHYFPAVIEASESGVPLLVLTADRPPELRHCHAGQTIDQTHLFHRYSRHFLEMPLPEPGEVLFRQVREMCRVAVTRACGPLPGPVQVNCPFREPFFSEREADSALCFPENLLAGLRPVTPSVETVPGDPLPLPERTVILAGPRPGCDSAEDLEALLAFSKRLRLPVLTDGAHPLRHIPEAGETIIVHYDRLVRDAGIWEELAPEAVILWGEPPTSKVLRQRLAAADVTGYHTGFGHPPMNPFKGRILHLGSDLRAALARFGGRPNQAYLTGWAGRDRYFEGRLREELAKPHDLFEADVHRALPEFLPEGTPVVFASSLAIRDAEWFLPRSDRGLRVYSQRGANGIDGTLSMARGIVAASGRPGVLVCGDLSFIHDSNGLLSCAQDACGLLVLVINNGGGGIFDMLPVAGHAASFEDLFLTPQAVDLKVLAAAHGVTSFRVTSGGELREALQELPSRGLKVVEIMVDRKASRALHDRFLKTL